MAVIVFLSDSVGHFGKGGGANVAFDVFAIFIQDKEDVGFFDILIEISEGGRVELGEALGVEWLGVIDDLVAFGLKTVDPILDLVLKFGAAGND